MYKYIAFAVICFVPLQLSAAEHPAALELLDRYAETQDKLRSSFIIKSEATGIINGYMKGGAHRAKDMKRSSFTELRFDGDRICNRIRTWGDNLPKTSYMSSLWDGNCCSRYTRWYSGIPDHGRIFIGKVGDDTRKKGMIPIGYGGHEILGIFFGDYEWVDSVLRQSKNISVRDRMEKIGTSDCYVIEAVVKNRGKYTLWIDPQHGYNIAQATVKKGENAILYGQAPKKIKVKVLNSLNNVHFKKINDIWLPKEADIELDRRWVNGDFASEKYHYKLIEITLNPDHDALGSFVRDDVRNGTEVILEGVPGITYIWQNGKVVDEKGRKVDYKTNEPAK